MKIWRFFSILALSALLVAMLAACESGSNGYVTQSGELGDGGVTSTPTAGATVSAPTTATPTSAPSTGGSPSTGGCTTTASCQQAIVTVTPSQVKPGGKVTVTVKGWVANAELQASIGVQAVESDIVYATSDAQGNFSTILTIYPQATGGIRATNIHIGLVKPADDSKGLLVQGKLTILAASAPITVAPTSASNTGGSPSTGGCTTVDSCQQAIVTVTPHQVKPGGKVTVTVKGWVANARLRANIGIQALESDNITGTSDAQGNFSVILTIDPRSNDFGPTIIHIGLDDSTDNSKTLNLQGELAIIE